MSAEHGSLPATETQIVIHEESRPLVVLPELGCYSFPLTLITEDGNSKSCPKGSPVFQTDSSLLPL